MNNCKFELYKTEKNEIEVRFESGETIWLNRTQLSTLFNRDIKTIGKHINNIFSEGELVSDSVVAKFATTANDGKKYLIEYYNLDVIISVGYRVKSIEGTKFRQWATKRLNDYLLEGVSINQKRLNELGKTIELIKISIDKNDFKINEAKGILEILKNYTNSFVLLSQFDSNRLIEQQLSNEITYEIAYEEAIQTISILKNNLIAKNEASTLFGNEKDTSFKGILGSVTQTFDGEYVYNTESISVIVQ